MAIANKNSDKKVVAVIGDGAITAGMAFEALSHAGHVKPNMLIVLNDNDMSISENVGGLNNYFSRIWASKVYKGIRKSGKGFLENLPQAHHIARKVEPGNSKEMFRAHFDSHIFTMVLPLKIPEASQNGSAGDLIYFPYARKAPTNEISNFIGKAYYKRFASKDGLAKFSSNHQKRIDNFKDYQPLLFVGNTTLHTNFPVSLGCSSYRLTLLAHFFDPSPKFGVGGLLRLLRNR